MVISWTAILIGVVRHRQLLPPWVAVVDAMLFAVALVMQSELMPAELTADGTTWVWTGSCVSVLIACWLLKLGDAMAVTAALVTAAAVGVLITPASWGSAAAALSFLSIQFLVGIGALAFVRAASGQADAALHRRLAVERTAEEERARELAHAEADVLFHDKVKNALFLLGAGYLRSKPGLARERARQAAETVSRLSTLGRRTASDLQSLDDVINEARQDGLRVAFLVSREGMNEKSQSQQWLPGAVLDAVSAATAQALANVRQHAGVAEAGVSVKLRPGRIAVDVTDDGVGFDVGSSFAGSEGMPGIVARLERIGGRARVSSVPRGVGSPHGTTWTLSWDGTVDPSRTNQDRRRIALAQTARAEYGLGFANAFVSIAALFHLGSMGLLVLSWDDYHSAPMAFACWCAMAAAGGLLAAGLYRPRVPAPASYLAAGVVVLAAVVVAMDCRPETMLGLANWSLSEAAWILVIFGLYRTGWEPTAAVSILMMFNCAIAMIRLDPTTSNVVKLASVSSSIVIVQIGAVLAIWFMRQTTSAAARDGLRAGEIVAGELAARAVREQRRTLFATIDARVGGLLTDIAVGSADPQEPSVQARCRQANDLLRQCAVLREAGSHDLIRLLPVAMDRRVTLEFSSLGRLDDAPPRLRRAAADRLERLLTEAGPGAGIVSVQAGIDLLTRNSSNADHATSVSLIVPVPSDAALLLARRVECEPDAGLEVALEVYEDNQPDEMFALMKVVIRP
ncbi:sensor histidine kinase [Micromonospora carbonacea]|uniref:sensor histidine kinase n=1 Tax=Micromonospora carbonacea TaxID=47853 RepID=UPI003D75888F